MSDPIAVLADAVNQLAIIVEEVAYHTPGGLGHLVAHALRGKLAPLIPDESGGAS